MTKEELEQGNFLTIRRNSRSPKPHRRDTEDARGMRVEERAVWHGSDGQAEGEWLLMHAGAEPGFVRPKAYAVLLRRGLH